MGPFRTITPEMRHLFVDDHVIERSTMERTFHRPQPHPGNPIFGVQTGLERTGLRYLDDEGFSPPMACTFDDGVFYDEADGLFKMWYCAGSGAFTALATSRDGLHWDRPEYDVVPGSNAVLVHEPGVGRDSFSPWIDGADPGPERYKAFLFTTNHASDLTRPHGGYRDASWLLTSPDGVHWERRARMSCDVGDNTLLFRDTVLERWCLSIRGGRHPAGRTREYLAAHEFMDLAATTNHDKRFWAAADERDAPDSVIGLPPQLYTIAPRRYEGVLVGVFTMWYGPDNLACLRGAFPKLTELQVGFSRDGIRWERPVRSAFVAASREEGRSDRGYLRASGGAFVVRAGELLFYYSGFSGIAPDGRAHMYAGGSMHLATMRRDGFASMDADGTGAALLTRPVSVTGSRLMLNASAARGEIRVGLLRDDETPIPGRTLADAVPVTGDQLRREVRWRRGSELPAGASVRLVLAARDAEIFSFWFE